MCKVKVIRYEDTVKVNGISYELKNEVSKNSCEGCAFITKYCAKDLTNICTNEHIIFNRIKQRKK